MPGICYEGTKGQVPKVFKVGRMSLLMLHFRRF